MVRLLSPDKANHAKNRIPSFLLYFHVSVTAYARSAKTDNGKQFAGLVQRRKGSPISFVYSTLYPIIAVHWATIIVWIDAPHQWKTSDRAIVLVDEILRQLSLL